MAIIAEIRDDFDRLIKRGTLSHTYLFYGFGGGKAELLEAIARRAETGSWDSEGMLTERMTMREAEGKTEAGIDDVRNAIKFLWQKPAIGERRTLLVPRAGQLTVNAEQALLKIVEDPPAHALILFAGRDPSALIAPLSSRLQQIFISADDSPAPKEGIERFREYLQAAPRARKEFLKKLVEDGAATEAFVAAALAHLRKDPERHHETLKALLERWSLIQRFNVNKRLQLEAALVAINE